MDRRSLITAFASAAGASLMPTAAKAQRVIGIGQQSAPPIAAAGSSGGDPDLHSGPYRKPAQDIRVKDAPIVRGTRDISATWLSGPVQRYRHYVLGADMEPETLTISMIDRRLFRLTLPKDEVFEDRTPRLVDIDGDGRDEVVVVTSHVRTGSSVAVAKLGTNADGLQIIARSEPPGQAFRWVNPAGIADFTGIGRPQIAVVRQPHVLGELDLLVPDGDRLVPILTVPDVSNHMAGSPHQTLYAVADFDGDGLPDLAIPTLDRRTLRFLSFRGRRARELARVALPSRVQEDFRVVTVAGRPAVEVGFAAGRRQVITP